MTRALAVTAVLASLGACAEPRQGGDHIAAWIADTSSYGPDIAPTISVGDRYREVAQKILVAGRADRGAYAKLAQLTDRIGHRIAGSPELDRAIEWAAQTMKDDGFEVHTERVMVPHWVRGAEDAQLLAPVARPLPVLGLGGTVATPKGGITANVIVVHDFTELEARASEVKGAIVLYDVAMPPYSETKGNYGYGVAVPYRSHGPARAAKLGAVGVLMRSVTPHSLHTLHTGATNYEAGQPKIPAAAVTVEDSELITRLAKTGPVQVHLHLESQQLLDVPSANVIAELRGREAPDEVVVIGGHLDSWDVGQGAHDDGAGCVEMMQAITVLKKLGLTPRRTIRVVLFTAEEYGDAQGAKAYAIDHAAELPRTVLALESDGGGFSPRGFSVSAKPEITARVVTRLTEVAALLRSLDAARITPSDHAGTDVEPMIATGVPTLNLDSNNGTYFDIHHSDADTLDKVDPAQLADATTAIAILAYVVADLPDRLDRP